MPKRSPLVSDYWAAFEGIPLMHDPKTADEDRALAAKGTCRCG